jgi:AraC-like DNA-binding protein
LRPEDLPPVLREAVDGTRSAGRLVSLPLQPTVANLVADTIQSQLEGEARALQFQGRLAELVAYTLDTMERAEAAPLSARRAQLRPRDADLAQMALARLARDYRRPPLFDDLARELGTNPNKLRTAFKDAYGVTMAEYCLERRLREAQQLLLEAKLTIAQIAERVGYEHQSAFTAAFSSHLGMTPRQYRQHRAPVSLALRPDTLPSR